MDIFSVFDNTVLIGNATAPDFIGFLVSIIYILRLIHLQLNRLLRFE
jgi:hypothetical protein